MHRDLRLPRDGKEHLISDFAFAHPRFAVLPDPFDLIDAADPTGVTSFRAQLRVAAERLEDPELGSEVIAERAPLDFVAYLRALDALDRSAHAGAVAEAEAHRAAAAMKRTDLWIVLPVVPQILVDADEDPDLRDAMDEALLDLLREEEL